MAVPAPEQSDRDAVPEFRSILAPPAAPKAAPGLLVQLLTAGCAACVADILTFPLDTIKVRLQIQGEVGMSAAAGHRGVWSALLAVARQEGWASLYNGLVPGLQRQMAFSAVRIGAYDSFKNYYQELTGIDQGIGLMLIRVSAGVTTGTLAILLAQPTDVVKVRMQAERHDTTKPRRYKGVMNAYQTIARQEGLSGGLYRGTVPNIVRNCIINVGEIVVYDFVKDELTKSGTMRDGIPCHFVSATMAGLAATLLASPADVIKTRYMNSPQGVYRGVLHCALEMRRREGLGAFYRGVNASFTRLVSWNIFLWLTFEQFKAAIASYY